MSRSSQRGNEFLFPTPYSGAGTGAPPLQSTPYFQDRLRRVRSKNRRRTQGRSAKESNDWLSLVWLMLTMKRQPQSRREKRGRYKPSIAVLLLLLLVWSICLGWGMAIALGASVYPSTLSATVQPNIVAQATPAVPGTVDSVPARYQLGQELYLENCASCHVALPPEVMPMETWRRLLLEPEQHYGQQLQPMTGPPLQIVWGYLQTFSRPPAPKEPIPYRVSESRFFKALHPKVKFPQPVKVGSCVSCHPGAAQYNYRSLTPEWENSP